MRKFVAAVAVVMVLAAGRAEAKHLPNGLLTRTATIDHRVAAPVSTTTRLQPVVGSVQRKSHFTNPFTHKDRYRVTAYNPVNGTFGKYKFRQ